MATNQLLAECRSFIECQFRDSQGIEKAALPFVTISRQAGAGGITIGNLLGEYLRETDLEMRCECPWTVFDRNLVHKVMEDHELSETLIECLTEEKSSKIQDAVEAFFGLHPTKWALVHQTAETMLKLAAMGHVILVGRGANIITRGMPGGFHVRLVGSEEKRLDHLQAYCGIDRKNARQYMKKEDEGRGNYVRKFLRGDIDDPLQYDLVINSDNLSYEDAATMIGEAVLRRERSRYERQTSRP